MEHNHDNQKYSFRYIIKRLLSPLFVGKSGYIRIGINVLLAGVMSTFYVWAIKSITNALNQGDVPFLWKIAISILIGYSILLLFRGLWDRWYRISGMRTSYMLNIKYLQKYLLLDNNYSESQGTGRMQNILFSGVDQWVNIIASLVSSLRGVFTIITSLILVFSTSILAGWYLISIFIVTTVITTIFSPYLKKRREKRSENRTENNKNFIRFLMSKFEILQNNKFSLEAQKFDSLRRQAEFYATKMYKYFLIIIDIPGFLVDIFRVLIPVLAIYVLNGYFTMNVGDIVLLLGMVALIDNVISVINSTYRNILENFGDVERLWRTFDFAPQIRGYDTGKDIIISEKNIYLHNITYNYGKGEVLKEFSLNIEGGKKTAFVGVSGSGKSTLIKLIAGYIHPQNGEVLIDDQPLPNENNTGYVSLKSYYKHIGYLTQEPNVFDGTIYENLTYALDHEPSQEDLESAIQGAQCQFIYEFPDGVQTEIGEKGIKLSGGQRQRLAIAKVMLKNPQIILLDEPTSALDSFSEEEVTKALNNLFESRTVIIIAHRLQTVKKADRIIVLDHGKIVEEGNHESLVKSGGVYAKMLELQSGF